MSQVQTDLERAVGDYRRLTEHLIQNADSLLDQASAGSRSGTAGSDPSAIAINNSCQRYVQYLLALEEILGHTEKLLRTSQHSMKLERGRKHLENVVQAVGSVSQCEQYAGTLAQLEGAVRAAEASPRSEDILKLLCTLSRSTVPRVRDATKGCRGMLSATMQQYLEECSWPPPLLPSATTSLPWKGFEDAGDAVFGELQEIIVQMLALQGAVDPAAFSGTSVGDRTPGEVALWPAMEFSSAVNGWISSHFAPDMPTCKIERPEWLFSAVLHAVQSCIDHVDVFEPCIEAQGIQQFFSMPVEVAKCVYKHGLCGVVKGVYVPLLFEERDTAYLLHFVDEVVKFEDSFLPLRTDPLLEVANQGPASSRREGCMLLDIICSDDEWRSQWVHHEEEEARQRIWIDMNESATYHGHDNDPSGPSEFERPWAASDEFRPSTAIRHAVETLVDLLNRTTYMSRHDNKHVWCHTVVSSAIEAIKGHLRSEILRAEQFDHLADSIGIPIVSGCLNDLRFLEHTLSEPVGELMEVLSSDPELLVPFVEQHASDLATLRRKWTNTVLESAMETALSSLQTDLDVTIRHVAMLLDEFSRHLDEVGFRALWKAVASSVDVAWADAVDSGRASGANQDGLEQLLGVFSTYTNKPRAYFRRSCAPRALV